MNIILERVIKSQYQLLREKLKSLPPSQHYKTGSQGFEGLRRDVGGNLMEIKTKDPFEESYVFDLGVKGSCVHQL